jgi:hypothetical protein
VYGRHPDRDSHQARECEEPGRSPGPRKPLPEPEKPCVPRGYGSSLGRTAGAGAAGFENFPAKKYSISRN